MILLIELEWWAMNGRAEMTSFPLRNSPWKPILINLIMIMQKFSRKMKLSTVYGVKFLRVYFYAKSTTFINCWPLQVVPQRIIKTSH